ncbi:MAG: hypothetical protein M9920_17095 [Verrucomicrobiae bacterium]|nr:hypothetical protein [Verrucomicrobiae bacterium]
MKAGCARNGSNDEGSFCTNILVDYLNGASATRRELDQYEEIVISIVTWTEIL